LFGKKISEEKICEGHAGPSTVKGANEGANALFDTVNAL
jgi:hypothetical protein